MNDQPHVGHAYIWHRVPLGDLERNHGGLPQRLASVAPVVASADATPIRQAREAFDRWHRTGKTAMVRPDRALLGQ